MKRHQFLQPLVDLLDLKKQNWRMILLMILVTVLVSAPVYARQVRVLQNDYKLHIEFTNLLLNRQFQEEPAAVYAHPLYQLLLIGLYSLTFKKIGLFGLAFLVQIAIQVVTVVIIYYWLGKPPKQGWDWFRAVLSITLVLVAPVMLLAFWDRLFYLGYIGLEIFHNPTTPLLRPLALASFLGVHEDYLAGIGHDLPIPPHSWGMEHLEELAQRVKAELDRDPNEAQVED